MTSSNLFVRETGGEYREATPKEVVASASRVVGKLFGRGSTITSPEDSVQFLTLKLAKKDHEVFCVLFLDTRHRVVAFEELSRGTIDSASILDYQPNWARDRFKGAQGD